MKVFVVTITFRGICHMAAQLTSALGHYSNATMIAPNNTAHYVEPPGKVIEINYPGHRYDPRFFIKLLQAAAFIRREKPDIVHMQDLHPIVWFLSLFLGKAKLVFTLHDVNPHPGEVLWYSLLARRLQLNKVDAIIVHGEALRQSLIQQCPSVAHKVHVIFHPVRTIFDKWRDPSIKEEKNILLFGRIVKYKGIDVFLKAAPKIHKALPDYTMTIAGSGDFSEYMPLYEPCKEYVRLDNRRIPDDEVAWLHQRCQMIVLPYLEGSQSGILATAYAFEKPVVVTRVGSIFEVVDEGRTGFIIPPGDVDALADAIIRLAKDDELREKMKPAIREKVESELSWDAAAKKTLEVYRKLGAANESHD